MDWVLNVSDGEDDGIEEQVLARSCKLNLFCSMSFILSVSKFPEHHITPPSWRYCLI